MSTYRHPPLNENLSNVSFTSDGLLKTDSQNREAQELLNGLLVELQINNLHQALIRDEVLTEVDVACE